MSLKKTVAIAAAVGALAAISAPAMALENEFHGLFNFNATLSNFQSGTSGDIPLATMFNTTTGNALGNFSDSRKANNYFEQRVRLQYTAKASDDLKLVTQFELNNRFGDANTDLDTDGANIVTKHAYLDYNIGQSFNTKLGLQAYKDTIKGLFIDADVPAIMTTTTLGAYKLNLGFSRFDDDVAPSTTLNYGNLNRLGDKNKDLFIMDNTFTISKDTKAALSYYFLADYAAGTTGYAVGLAPSNVLELGSSDQALLISTFALSGETKVGPVSLSGFAAMQAGHQKYAVGAITTGTNRTSSRYYHGYAANVAAKVAVGPGTVKGAFLFTSGNNNENDAQYRGWVSSSINSYNESGMMILARNTANSPTSTDAYVRRNVTNIALLTMGYDANLTDKLFVNGNLGFAWAPATNAEQHIDIAQAIASGNDNNNGSDFMGTEVNLETGYKLYNNLTLKAQAAYMMLGGYYKNSALKPGYTAANQATYVAATPENPYSIRLHAQFKF